MGAAPCAVEPVTAVPGGPVATIPPGVFETAASDEASQRRLGAVAEVLCDLLMAAMNEDAAGDRWLDGG
jgi:hypothetical protein